MRKYDFISALAKETAAEVVKNHEEWMRYLTTVVGLYKYPFREQLLIYAQRLDATACASIKIWNERIYCWVNKGAKGISLLDEDDVHGKRLKYVFDLPEVETYLQDKAQQEQINNQLVTQGRENALEQQPEKEKIAEENIISELEKEPVIEPETVHITFTVAECGEFHTIGEFHEGIETIEEAMKLYNAINPSHMHGIPSIGVNMHIDGTEEWEDEEADIVRENCIDVDFLNYTPELRDMPTVQDALKKLIAAYPEKDVNERETKEMKIQTIAAELDQLSYDIDTFEYRDSVPDREAQVQMIANDIRSGNVKPLQIFLQTSIDEGIDEESERQAKELLVKLAEYKPLAKIEELEEQNYNMIDDRLNNGVEKFNREEEKKEQAEKPQVRSSLKERLAAKQKEVAQGKKDSQRTGKIKEYTQGDVRI